MMFVRNFYFGLQRKFSGVPKKSKLVLFIVVFGVIGTLLLIRSFASSPSQATEAESGTKSGNASTAADSSASGGSYVKFASASSAAYDSGRLESEDQSVVNRIHLDKNCYHWSWAINGTHAPIDSVASGGEFCGSFGATDTINWDKIGFTINNVPSSGTYTLRIAYRNGYSSTAQNTLLINGASVGPLDFEVTSEDLGGEDYGRPFTLKEISVNLQSGTNTFQINASTGWTGFADLDYFQVFGSGGGSGGGGGGSTVKCVVYLHGKGGYGGDPADYGDFTSLAPNGNADGWGALQWLYWPESSYQQIVSTITNEINGSGCTKVIIHGFSNGAAAAAYVYCRGNTFGGKLVGVIVDDPVMDNGVDNCSPGAGVKVKLYTTGGIPFGPADCASLGDWTCINGSIIGLSTYTSRLGVTNTQSAQFGHERYSNPPELTQWW